MKLTEAQVAQYWQDGYLVVENLLSPEEVEAFVSYENEPKPEGWRNSLQNHKSDEVWGSVAKNANITAITQQLLEGNPYIVQTMYLEKKPELDGQKAGTGTAMHQDFHYLPCEPNTLMACWVAMSDTDEENGGLCVIPKSNHQNLHSTHRTENTADHDSWEMEYLMRDRSGKEWIEKMYSFEIDGLNDDEIVALSVPAGGGVFFTGMTIHGSYGNRSTDRVRRAFAIHYCKEGTWMLRDDVQRTTLAV